MGHGARKKNRPALSRRLSPEIWVLLGFSVVWVIGLCFGLPPNWPTWSSVRFVRDHYFGPLLLAGALQLALQVYLGARRAKRGQSDSLLLFKLVPFVVLATFLHFNFKAWIPLVNPALYDTLYLNCDDNLRAIVSSFFWVRRQIATLGNVDFAYHRLFVGMFFVSMAAHSVWDTTLGQRRLVMGLCLILLAGGISYWIAPALGRFLFEPGMNAAASETQRNMLRQWHELRATGVFPANYFVAPLAAMPSLHIAHAVLFTVHARAISKTLFVVFFLFTGWFVVESVASGFHYLIDLPMGGLLMWVCFSLSRRLLPDKPHGRKHAA